MTDFKSYRLKSSKRVVVRTLVFLSALAITPRNILFFPHSNPPPYFTRFLPSSLFLLDSSLLFLFFFNSRFIPIFQLTDWFLFSALSLHFISFFSFSVPSLFCFLCQKSFPLFDKKRFSTLVLLRFCPVYFSLSSKVFSTMSRLFFSFFMYMRSEPLCVTRTQQRWSSVNGPRRALSLCFRTCLFPRGPGHGHRPIGIAVVNTLEARSQVPRFLSRFANYFISHLRSARSAAWSDVSFLRACIFFSLLSEYFHFGAAWTLGDLYWIKKK